MRKLSLTKADWKLIQRSVTERRDRLAEAADERRARGLASNREETAAARHDEVLAKLDSNSTVERQG